MVAVSLAFLITVGLWWTYFDHFAAIAEERLRVHDNAVLAAADSYSYIHLLLVAGIIVFAVGAKEAVAHTGDPLAAAERLALCGGVALYLVGHTAFRLRIARELGVAKLVAAGACVVLFAVSGGWDAWVTAAALAGILGVLVAAESAS